MFWAILDYLLTRFKTTVPKFQLCVINILNHTFQYNNMSLGLMMAATACLFHFHDYLASILFVAALNYKQMELYHALPFFSYLLGRCLLCSSWSKFVGKLATIGALVIATFCFIWLPFLLLPMSQDPFLQVCSMKKHHYSAYSLLLPQYIYVCILLTYL